MPMIDATRTVTIKDANPAPLPLREDRPVRQQEWLPSQDHSRDDRLTCEVMTRVDEVSPSDWQRLFPGVSNIAVRIQLNERTGTDGFSFRCIVVKEHERIILCLPLFEMTYNLSNVIEGKVRAVAAMVARWWPGLLCPRMLGVGFVGGEESQIGYARDVDLATLQTAWDLALQSFDALAQQLRATVLTFVNFTNESGRWIPIQQLTRFTPLKSLPYCTLPIVYENLDGYLGSLSKSTRKDLRRKLRNAQRIEIRRTQEPGPWLDTIYQWYLQTVERSDAVFGTQRRDYFAQVCQVIPGAEFVLYFEEGRLCAFNLIIVTPKGLTDQYFGMDETVGRQYALYFISWLENIRYCIAHQIPRYDAGQGAEDTKGRLGIEMAPSLVLFCHRNPILHGVLTTCLKRFAEQPSGDLPMAQLGLGWEAVSAREPQRVQVALVRLQHSS